MNEWTRFQQSGLLYDNCYFKPMFTLGDGNCLFRSIVQSEHFPTMPHEMLRSTLMDKVQKEVLEDNSAKGACIRHEYFTHNSSETRTLNEHIERMKRQCIWGTETEVFSIHLLFGVRIVSIINDAKGLIKYDSTQAIIRVAGDVGYNIPDEILNSPETIYIYYHRYNAPMQPTSAEYLNHFCLLIPTNVVYGHPYMGFIGCRNHFRPVDMSNMPITDTTTSSSTAKRQRLTLTNTGIGTGNPKPNGKRKSPAARPVTSKQSKSDAKQLNQTKLIGWLSKVTTNANVCADIQKCTNSVADMERRIAVVDTMESIIKKVEAAQIQQLHKTVPKIFKQRKEMTWFQRAVIVYYHLHPLLGKQSYENTQRMFDVKFKTLEGWLSKTSFVEKWHQIVKDFNFDDVVKQLPDKTYSSFILKMDISQKYKELRIPVSVPVPQKPLVTKNSNFLKSHQSLYAACKTSGSSSRYLKTTDKRIRSNSKTIKHLFPQQIVEEAVQTRWNTGIPVTVSDLIHQVINACEKEKIKDTNCAQWLDIYGKNNTKRTVWLHRAISKIGFSVRKATISQKVPENWRQLAEDGARRVRHKFKMEDVDVVLGGDETFIRFHEAVDKVIAPTGVKRVGSSIKTDDKSGCTVLPTMDMTYCRLLPPLVIFSGVFCSRLMHQWRQYNNSFVLFTPSHWMTSETFVLYLKWIMMHYPGKKIGLIVDYAPSHFNSENSDWLQKLNDENEDGTTLILEWVDKGLTSVYQPGDISINKPLKSYVREAYHDHVTKELERSVRAGVTLKISRAKLLEFIEMACKRINDNQKISMSIYKSFKMCGLNPWDEELEEFRLHLDSLSVNKVYDSLLRSQKALNL